MKGILFTPKNIKATVELRKTQTRRVINPQPKKPVATKLNGCWAFDKDGKNVDVEVEFRKPRYLPGETVYIKEAWRTLLLYDDLPPSRIPKYAPIWYKDSKVIAEDEELIGRWRSPLHLPAKFARHFVKMGEPKAERLQEINKTRHDEVLKEGYPFIYDITTLNENPVNTFARYWNSINKVYTWDKNPWVFVYTYQLVSPPKERR